MMNRLASFLASSGCRSARKREERINGQDVNDCQSGAEAEVLIAQSQPLQSVRPSARLSAQISALPNLLPAALARRIYPGRDEGKLVRPAERQPGAFECL